MCKCSFLQANNLVHEFMTYDQENTLSQCPCSSGIFSPVESILFDLKNISFGIFQILLF